MLLPIFGAYLSFQEVCSKRGGWTTAPLPGWTPRLKLQSFTFARYKTKPMTLAKTLRTAPQKPAKLPKVVCYYGDGEKVFKTKWVCVCVTEEFAKELEIRTLLDGSFRYIFVHPILKIIFCKWVETTN